MNNDENKEETIKEEQSINTEEQIIDQAIKTQEENINYNVNNEVQNSNYDTNKEFVRDTKINEKALQEQIETILSDIDEKEKKQEKKNSKKNILFLIGVFLEIIIILLIIKFKYISVPEKYTKTLTCTNKTQELNSEYYVKLVNKYYFTKDDIVGKLEANVYYVFMDKSEYISFKSKYKSTDVKDFKGLTQTSIFDDKNDVYNNKSVYNYKKLKKNENVTEENGSLIINIPGKPNQITLSEDNYKSVKQINENMDFKCE